MSDNIKQTRKRKTKIAVESTPVEGLINTIENETSVGSVVVVNTDNLELVESIETLVNADTPKTVKESRKEKKEIKTAKVIDTTAPDFRDKISAIIGKHCPNTYLNSYRLDFIIKVLKNNGTVAINEFDKIIHKDRLSPEEGGVEYLSKTYSIKTVINDLI